MKPINQTVFTVPPNPPGDCLRACVASVLELDLERVPNFVEQKLWFEALIDWLFPLDLSAVFLALPPSDEFVSLERIQREVRGFHIGGGPSVRGHMHACVYKGREMVHDPYPGGEGLTELKNIILFVDLDPKGHVSTGGDGV